MPDLDLSGTTIVVTAPDVPVVTMGAPVDPLAVVVPVAGPPGAAGSAGGRYLHTQTAVAATWTVTHNLGGYPLATVLLAGDPGRPVATDTDYPDANTLVLTFPSPVSGRAYL